MEKLYDPTVTNKDSLRFRHTPVKVNCTVTLHGQDREDSEAIPEALSCVESYLHDLFLMLNLSAPGCCTFWPSTLRPKGNTASWRNRDLKLSEYSFDNAYIRRYDGAWPAPKLLDVEVVRDWYLAVRRGTNQIPENRTQKVLFALMHICKSDLAIDTIISLFYALETFFDTQPGENRRALTNRIGLLLSPNDKQMAYLKDQLRKLYDMRSGFAHGGLEIAHPMNDESLDKRAEGKYLELMAASEVGFAILVTSLQCAIERNLSELRFHETMKGVSAQSSA